MALFPALNAPGVRAHYPNSVAFEHLTNVTNLPPGPRTAYSWRNEPLARFTLNLKGLTDAETATIENFFRSMKGRFGRFIYVDPTGNLLQNSEDFTQASWTTSCIVGAATADPAGGTAATILSGDGSGNASLSQAVSIDPAAVGSPACFSVYLKAITAAGAFNIFATDGATTINQSCNLSTTSWLRVVLPWTFGASGAVTIGIGGNLSWTGTNQIAVFGPMLSMTPAAAAYLRTPGFWALHRYCRFDQDAFDANSRGPNQSDVTLKIVEFAPAVPTNGSIALAIDMSGSIADSHALPSEQSAALAFSTAVDARWRLGLWTFNAAITLRQDYTLDRSALAAAISALSAPIGGTHLYDLIVALAATYATSIVLLTDGMDEGSVNTQAAAIAACNAAGVSIYALGFGSADEAALTAMTAATGGAYLIAPTLAQIAAMILQIVNQL